MGKENKLFPIVLALLCFGFAEDNDSSHFIEHPENDVVTTYDKLGNKIEVATTYTKEGKTVLTLINDKLEEHRTYSKNGFLVLESLPIDSLTSKDTHYDKDSENISLEIYYKRLNTNIPRQESKAYKFILYYMNGNKMTEGGFDSRGKFFKNSWLVDGQQILQDGSGQYFTYHDRKGQNIKLKVMVENGLFEGKCEYFDVYGNKVKETFYVNGEIVPNNE